MTHEDLRKPERDDARSVFDSTAPVFTKEQVDAVSRVQVDRLEAEPERLAVARAVAAYELGSPDWADMIVLAYLDPNNQMFDEALGDD